MATEDYVIRGGIEGRERLRILARVMLPTTQALFERVGISSGATCLDAGCGGGDVTVELARRVGTSGRVVGLDLDEAKLEIARTEARDQGIENVEFRIADAMGSFGDAEFDVVYARFLLTHLSDPASCLRKMRSAVKKGGIVVVEDIDISGFFSYPESKALKRFMELYTRVVDRRGGNANIGPRLPVLLLESAFERVGMNVVQPAGLDGEVKLISPITMENIADPVLADGLSTAEEIKQITEELYAFARNQATVASLPRIVQAWGYRAE